MQKADTPQRRLIVVDDDEGIRQIIGRVALDAGFDVETAADSRQLYNFLDIAPAMAIILDLNMEGQDGIEVMRELARRKVTSKIILFSGSDQRLLDHARQLGEDQGLSVVAAFQKPVRIKVLVEILDKLEAVGSAKY